MFTIKNIPRLCQRHKHPHLSVSLKSMCDKPVSMNCTRRENFHGREQLLSLTIIGWLQQYPWLAWLFQFCHFLWICKLQDPFSHFFDFPHTIILYTVGCFDPNILSKKEKYFLLTTSSKVEQHEPRREARFTNHCMIKKPKIPNHMRAVRWST